MSLISQLKRALQELTDVFYLFPGDEVMGDPVKANGHASFCLTVSSTGTLQAQYNSEPPADFKGSGLRLNWGKLFFVKRNSDN